MKLKTTFKILIAVSIVLPAVIVGIAGSYIYSDFYNRMVTDEAASAAYSSAKAQTLFFDRYEASLSAMSKINLIQRAAGGDYTAIKDQVDDILSGTAANDEAVLDMIITDSNGLVVANTKTELNLAQNLFEGYSEQLNPSESSYIGADGVYISPVFIDNEKYGTGVIYIVKAVENTSGSVGYIAAAADADVLNNYLTTSSFLNNNGIIMFRDGAGNIINANGSIARADSAALPVSIPETAAEAAADQKYTTFSENGYFGSYGTIGGSDWIWIGTYPASAAEADIKWSIIFGLFVFSAFIVLDTIIAFAIYRRAITPIGVITSSMEEINSGDRQKRLPSFKGYEYQLISEAFNDLLDDSYISEDVHKTIASLSNSMLFEWNLDDKSMYCSDNFLEMFGIDASKATLCDGGFLDLLMTEKDARHFQKDMNTLINNDREYIENEYQVKNKDGDEIWVNVKASSVTNRVGDTTRVLGVVTDITKKKNTSLQLSQKASYDFLSQLYNRSTFLRELQKMLERRRPDETLAILFIDVDDFKFVNDRYGHNVGDEVIKYVADTLKASVGGSGIAGRFGGDEFVICVNEPEKVNECDNFAMSIIDSLYQGYNCQSLGIILNVQASIGICLAGRGDNNAETIVGAADEAMYFVKKNGKANYHIYEPADGQSLDLGNTLT